MEGEPTKQELISRIDLDTYLSLLPIPDLIDGKIMESPLHTFYFWLTKNFPEFQNIDGVSLEELYLKNVIETGMEEDDFINYCRMHGFPVFEQDNFSFDDLYGRAFRMYMMGLAEEKNNAYETWAAANGINTAPGAIMRFIDNDGNEYRVRTDTEHRGEIIAE